MKKSDKSKWSRVSEDYESFFINKQLLFTQNTFEIIFKYFINDLNVFSREGVSRIIVEIIFYIIFTIIIKTIDQLNNKEFLIIM